MTMKEAGAHAPAFFSCTAHENLIEQFEEAHVRAFLNRLHDKMPKGRAIAVGVFHFL